LAQPPAVRPVFLDQSRDRGGWPGCLTICHGASLAWSAGGPPG
jgi:hypothetical protein